jgi:hypothetical protein
MNYYSECDKISGPVFGSDKNIDYWPSGYDNSCLLLDWATVADIAIRSTISIEFITRWIVTSDFHSIYYDFLPYSDKIASDVNHIVEYGQPNDCDNRFTFWAPVPEGYGAAFDVVTGEAIVYAACEAGHVRVRAGAGRELQYVYKEGYEWNGSSWQKLRFSGLPVSGNDDWFVGEAFAELTRTPDQQGQDNYVLAYVCTWTGAQWKCGCRDAACDPEQGTGNLWQLQNFRRQ